MARTLATTLVVLLGLWTAPAWGGPPFLLNYLVPAGTVPTCNLPEDPATSQGGNPAILPVLTPANLPLATATSFDLCVQNWPPDSGSGTPCIDGTGAQVCALKQRYVGNGALTIVNFTPAAGFRARRDGNTVIVVGGDPIASQSGGIRLGQLVLSGQGSPATFEMQAGSHVSAAMARLADANSVLAETSDTCGNGTTETGEECDDGATASGDGCFRTCEDETGFEVTGTAAGNGTIDWFVSGVALSLDLSTFPNAPAGDVVQALVATVNEDDTLNSLSIRADQVAATGQSSGPGRELATNGISGTPTTSDTGTLQFTFVPEPGGLLLLVSGLAFLATVGRRRMQP
jgi:cysteine-rich repeat protein